MHHDLNKALAVLFFSSLLLAEESNQLRMATHIRYFITEKSAGQGVFLVGWTPVNLMSGVSDNANLFLGVGYASKKWSIESMLWKQWSLAGNSFSLDWRLMAKPARRVSLYAEVAPRLDKRSLYDFTVLDVRVLGPLNVGFENENTHRVGRDTFGYGPRIAVTPAFKILGARPVVAVSRQSRTLGPNVKRVYVFLNWTF